jgi:hypothetical protein
MAFNSSSWSNLSSNGLNTGIERALDVFIAAVGERDQTRRRMDRFDGRIASRRPSRACADQQSHVGQVLAEHSDSLLPVRRGHHRHIRLHVDNRADADSRQMVLRYRDPNRIAHGTARWRCSSVHHVVHGVLMRLFM